MADHREPAQTERVGEIDDVLGYGWRRAVPHRFGKQELRRTGAAQLGHDHPVPACGQSGRYRRPTAGGIRPAVHKVTGTAFGRPRSA